MMEDFDAERPLHNLIKEFSRTDEFYNSFRQQFIITIFLVIKKYFKEKQLDQKMDQNLRLYADEMLSCVETVLYKDKSYPDYRLAEELEMLGRVVGKQQPDERNPEFVERIHMSAKELIVNHYPDVFDLSADGFRLLEKYAKMYNWEFLTNFYAMSEA